MASNQRGEVLWQPDPAAWEATAAGRFARRHGFDDYAALHAWSVAELEEFWAAVASEVGVRWRSEPTDVLPERAMPGARWFPGATLNYAEHALAAAASRPGDLAVLGRSQTRAPVALSWAELVTQVSRAAAGLGRLGVARGSCVAAYAPNIPETLVLALATASLGAVWSSCAPEFGTRAVVDRFAQIEPSVLVAVDGYRYGDKVVDRGAEVAAIHAALPTVRHVVGLRYLGTGADDWSELLAGPDPGPPHVAAVPFDHPLWVLYSSGTTGLPKAIVHGHGGITLEHLKVLTLHQDLRPEDRFLWFTTTGWMMWNYLVSGLLTGATVVLFDGDPGYGGPGALWAEAHAAGATIFGSSAPFLMASRKAQLRPERGAVRWVGSTGAPLPAEGARWVHDALGVPVSSISGGTDVCSAFVGTSPLVAVRAGEISCRLLGCAVEAFDPTGAPCPPGVTGELVLTAPMPSMPVALWGDADGSRYRAAYFEHFPGTWRHGDWVTFTEDGACVISGRSDATLNRGGVRLGTSDLYTVVEGMPEVADSLVVHLESGEGDVGELVLFVALAPGASLDDDLRGRIAGALRRELSPRHVPDRVEAVPAVPRTLSGKKLEVPVKRILGCVPAELAASRDSLADPGSLAPFERFATQRGAGA
ncbi:MAG: acetoacetate--CoA ligase [Acidimicrobiia bacterium]|nr:acetoacetate--CoA ligase [Acidimicrobiia bacterium]